MCVPCSAWSSGAIMEMRYAPRYCTPKRAWVWVGAREKTCSLLSATENRGFGSNPKTEELGNGHWREQNSLVQIPRNHLGYPTGK